MDRALATWRTAGQTFEHAGREIFYRRGGEGPPLLLVHGYPFGSFEWHRLWAPLTARFHVIAPDMLGLGFSEKPWRHAYSLTDHANMHEALLRELGVAEMGILAHDLGVSVAQELLARRHDDPDLPRVTGAVFLNGGLCPEAYQPRRIQTILGSPAGQLVGPLLPDSAIRSAVLRLFGPESQPSRQEIDRMIELSRYRRGRLVVHKVGRFVYERQAVRNRLVSAVMRERPPLRLINGTQDPNSGGHMVARFLELVPDADVVRLEGIGHFPHLEATDQVAAAVLEFFATTFDNLQQNGQQQ